MDGRRGASYAQQLYNALTGTFGVAVDANASLTNMLAQYDVQVIQSDRTWGPVQLETLIALQRLLVDIIIDLNSGNQRHNQARGVYAIHNRAQDLIEYLMPELVACGRVVADVRQASAVAMNASLVSVADLQQERDALLDQSAQIGEPAMELATVNRQLEEANTTIAGLQSTLVAENEQLKRENEQLRRENEAHIAEERAVTDHLQQQLSMLQANATMP